MRELLFQVEAWTRSDDRMYVAGRNCGDTLRIDDDFVAASPRLSRESAPVRLRIARILTYRKYINQLDSGVTAELELTGAAQELSADPFDLRGASSEALFPSYEILEDGDFHVEPHQPRP